MSVPLPLGGAGGRRFGHQHTRGDTDGSTPNARLRERKRRQTQRMTAPDSQRHDVELLGVAPDRHVLLERRPQEVVCWSVEEVRCADTPGARAEHCLIFHAPHAVRRVYDYPPDWRTLSAEGLLALSWRR